MDRKTTSRKYTFFKPEAFAFTKNEETYTESILSIKPLQTWRRFKQLIEIRCLA